MKNTIKTLWMTAIVAVGFSFASCVSFGGGGGYDGGARWADAMATAEWPASEAWERYGVEGGLRQPSGTTVLIAHAATYAELEILTVAMDANRAAFDDLVSQIEGKGGWRVHERESTRREESISFVKGNNGLAISFDVRENGLTIIATPNAED